MGLPFERIASLYCKWKFRARRYARGAPAPAGAARSPRLRHHARVTRVTFTSQLRRFTQTPDLDVTAATLRDALAAAFDVNPRLRGYVLDDQAHLRANVVVFIDGLRVRDRVTLDDRLGPDSQVHVMQALSGG